MFPPCAFTAGVYNDMGDEEVEYSLEDYKDMSATQRNKVKKSNLQVLLNESIMSDPVSDKLDRILEELANMKGKNESIEKEIKRIDKTVLDQNKILSAHQKFMEDLDSEKRAKHMIVLGVKEDQDKTDEEKFHDIVSVIGVNTNEIKVENIVRLGAITDDQPNKTRPMKVSFEKNGMREKILKLSKNLKDQGGPYERIFLKKDTHPEVRKEEKRLYEVFKAEKNKGENADKEVAFDRKTRVVTVNGQEIDRFQLFSSFQ